jgi:serine/threonine-protein kinase
MNANDLTGALLADRYSLERKLGSGGMADVWLAEDQELGRKVAVKILHERYANDAQFVERFRREATHAAGLSHPNIVSIFDRGVSNGSYYIVMEYVEGRTLKELIVTRGPCPVPVAISYTRQILAGLRYAHRNGIIHRDIKPHNVIVDREGRVKVADFGIARAGASEMTEAGSIVGTAQYLSPEQARGAPVDESSDLYSTGVVLYELLTGTVPFTGETPVEIAMKHLSQAPEAPSRRAPGIPRDLDLVVLRALAKEPADRYRNAGELDRDLELVARGEPVGDETEHAATMVLSGAGAIEAPAATQVTRRIGPTTSGGTNGGEERYRAYDGPVARGRGWWPWVLGLGALIALAAAGYFLYGNVQSQIDEGKPVAVGEYEGLLEAQAVNLIVDSGFEAKVRRLPSLEVAVGIVYDQDPSPGTRLAKGSIVTILVSSGKPTALTPDVVGMRLTDAVTAITQAGLKANTVDVNSEKPTGTVTAQAPKAGTSLVVGAEVRINVSKGPKPIGVPSVIGLLYDTAASQLQAAGFAVARVDVDNDQPAGVVVDQAPAGNSTASAGSTVTLSVSNGPTTTTLPDVTGQSSGDATATLEAAGFKVTVALQDTDVERLNDVVISQDPPGSTQQDPATAVTLFVGFYVPPTDTTPTDTTPTDTTPTDTTPTDTTPAATTPAATTPAATTPAATTTTP